MDMMHPQKIDRRIVKSKREIELAFLALLKEKEYKDISLSMIAEKAGVNRGTIYKHYEDREGLLEETLQRGAESILKKLDLYQVFDFPTDLTQEQFYHLLATFPSDYLGYSNAKVNSDLFLRVQTLFCAQAEALLLEHYFSRSSVPEESKPLFARYMAQTLFVVLTDLEQRKSDKFQHSKEIKV